MTLYVDRPKNPNGMCIITDARFKYDKELQEAQGGQPVLREWAFGKAALGQPAWASCTRIALYDYLEDTEAAPTGLSTKRARTHVAGMRAAKRAELLSHLMENKYSIIVVLQTRGAEVKSKDDFGDAVGLKGTMCWSALDTPDSLPEMAGTVWESPYGRVMGLLNPVNHEYVHGEAIRRHLIGAHGLATGKAQVLEPDPDMTGANNIIQRHGLLGELFCNLTKDIDTPLAVDIESYSTDNLITAIGISDGVVSVSVPWDSFTPYGTSELELGRSQAQERLVKNILASNCPKIFHNYTYDVPFLEAKGCPVGGTIHDTMALHGIVYKQWRHGLQRACATELLIPPWKSIWHPKHPPSGLSKDDAEWWILEPTALREYNAKDAFYTWHLANALAWKAGVKL